MNLAKYRCPDCRARALIAETAVWRCLDCGHIYPCVDGIPRLYIDRAVGDRDRLLRDRFYDGFLGKHYQHVMPFLSLPARPVRVSLTGWLVYVLSVAVILGLACYGLAPLLQRESISAPHAIALAVLTGLVTWLAFHPYLFYLLALAVPVKASIRWRRFRPARTFQQVHADVIDGLRRRPGRLQVLDIATGTCNSLYRHGWMSLDADYTGLDLSETMLLQGRRLMAERHVPVDLVLGDAACLPFGDATFDVVLNYGGLNGFTDPRLALEEMARVSRPGGLVLFLDEQLYDRATFIERLYFRNVLSSHNGIHHCPVESMPADLTGVAVHQVYPFYYLCTCSAARRDAYGDASSTA